MSTSARRITAISPTGSGPATPTTPTGKNTASATIAAAGALRHGRPPRGSRPARSLARCWGRGSIRGALVQIGPHAIDRDAWDWAAAEDNPFWCPDRTMAVRWAEYLDGVRKAGLSAGAVIEVVASGV